MIYCYDSAPCGVGWGVTEERVLGVGEGTGSGT
jgi:hypothetical protein